MVMEKENWQIMPLDTIQVVSFSGLAGDGAALIVSSDRYNSSRSVGTTGSKKGGFSYWQESGNPFLSKLNGSSEDDSNSFHPNESATQEAQSTDEISQQTKTSSKSGDAIHTSGTALPEDEHEDLHADFIDEDSQLPSRISKPRHSRHSSLRGNDGDMTAQTGSSLSLLRLMDKYARLMQKLEMINVEFFKGICQLFGIFFHFVFESFCELSTQPSGKGLNDFLPFKVKSALSRITQDCDQWIKPQFTSFSSSPTSGASFTHMDVTPTSPPSHTNHTSFALKERCAGVDTISLVAQLLHKSKAHLQSRLVNNNGAVVDDFYVHLADAVPELTQLIHRTTAKLLLHINGYVDRISNAKWELGLEHNGYVDLLLGEFKHFKTRLAHGGIRKEVQDLLLEYGIEIVAETLIDEGRALMSLDLH